VQEPAHQSEPSHVEGASGLTPASGTSSSASLSQMTRGPSGSSQASGSQSSGSGFQTLQALCHQYFSDSQAPRMNQVATMEDVVAEMQRQHLQEIQELKSSLNDAHAREAWQTNEAATMANAIHKMQGSAPLEPGQAGPRPAPAAAAVVNELQSVRGKQIAAEQQRDDLKDKMKGMEVKLQVKVERIKEEIQASKKEQSETVQEMEVRVQKQRDEAKEQSHDLKKEAKSAEMKLQTAAAERDVLQRQVSLDAKVHRDEVSTLETVLAEVRQDLMEQKVVLGTAEDKDLAHELVASQEANVQMQTEMQELRLQMLGIERGQGRVKADLQFKLDNANSELEEEKKRLQVAGKKLKPPRAGRNLGKGKTAGAVLLTSIDEEGDNVSISGSAAGSGVVSSDGNHDGVGDLRDFDGDSGSDDDGSADVKHEEKVESILSELEHERRQHLEYQEEVAGKEAREKSKKDRLEQKVTTMRVQKTEDAANMVEQKAELEEAIVHREQEMRKKQAQLGNLLQLVSQGAQDREKLYDTIVDNEAEYRNDIEETRRQLYRTLETTRVSDQSMQAAKLEMQLRHESEISEYEATLSDLREKVRAAGFDDAFDDGEQEHSQTHILTSLREERNELHHKLEWKEVQWKGKVDTTELQYASDIVKLKRANDQELSQLKHKYDQEKAELTTSIEELEKIAETNVADKADSSEVGRPAESLQTKRFSPLNWLSLLRCPTRVDAADSKSLCAFSQAMCWHVLNSVPDVTALLCELKDLQITSVSKKAYKVWGGSSLHGHTLQTLVHTREEAAWLQKAISSNQLSVELEKSEIGGFLVRELGCLAFRSRSGECFDSITTTVHMPAEPALGKNKAIIIILHPLLDEDEGPQRVIRHRSQEKEPQDKQGSIRGLGRASRVYSEASDDIAPSDSVSHVAERRYT